LIQQEPEYWEKRLARQMYEEQISQRIGISSGNFSSYLKALSEPIVSDNNHIQLELRDIGPTALKNDEILKKQFLTS
jgi:hypothetical protein